MAAIVTSPGHGSVEINAHVNIARDVSFDGCISVIKGGILVDGQPYNIEVDRDLTGISARGIREIQVIWKHMAMDVFAKNFGRPGQIDCTYSPDMGGMASLSMDDVGMRWCGNAVQANTRDVDDEFFSGESKLLAEYSHESQGINVTNADEGFRYIAEQVLREVPQKRGGSNMPAPPAAAVRGAGPRSEVWLESDDDDDGSPDSLVVRPKDKQSEKVIDWFAENDDDAAPLFQPSPSYKAAGSKEGPVKLATPSRESKSPLPDPKDRSDAAAQAAKARSQRLAEQAAEVVKQRGLDNEPKPPPLSRPCVVESASPIHVQSVSPIHSVLKPSENNSGGARAQPEKLPPQQPLPSPKGSLPSWEQLGRGVEQSPPASMPCEPQLSPGLAAIAAAAGSRAANTRNRAREEQRQQSVVAHNHRASRQRAGDVLAELAQEKVKADQAAKVARTTRLKSQNERPAPRLPSKETGNAPSGRRVGSGYRGAAESPKPEKKGFSLGGFFSNERERNY